MCACVYFFHSFTFWTMSSVWSFRDQPIGIEVDKSYISSLPYFKAYNQAQGWWRQIFFNKGPSPFVGIFFFKRTMFDWRGGGRVGACSFGRKLAFFGQAIDRHMCLWNFLCVYEIFYVFMKFLMCLWNFHRRCLSTSSMPWCKKVENDQKLKSRGSCPPWIGVLVIFDFFCTVV